MLINSRIRNKETHIHWQTFWFNCYVLNIVWASAKRCDLLWEIQATKIFEVLSDCKIPSGHGLNQKFTLKHFSDTYWGSHYGTFMNLIQIFFSIIIDVLEMKIICWMWRISVCIQSKSHEKYLWNFKQIIKGITKKRLRNTLGFWIYINDSKWWGTIDETLYRNKSILVFKSIKLMFQNINGLFVISGFHYEMSIVTLKKGQVCIAIMWIYFMYH